MQTWTISGVKERARNAFKANYWKIMLVTLLVGMITGAGGGVSSGVGNMGGSSSTSSSSYEDEFSGGDLGAEIENTIKNMNPTQQATAVGVAGIAVIVLIVIFIVVFVFSVAYAYFLANPFMVGAKRFYNRSLVEDANVRELVSSFGGGNYLRTVKIMFLMNLFTGLWTMLFIIPGIIKSYEYRMIPYIIMENPELSSKEVFARSKQLMDGNKWSTFLLDLSFIGWWILAIFTCGLLGIFWVSPYQAMADAALYRELSGADRYEYQNSGYQTTQNSNPYGATGYTGQQSMNNQNGYYNQQNMNSQYNQQSPNGQYTQNGYYDQQNMYNQNTNSYNQNGSAGQQNVNSQYDQNYFSQQDTSSQYTQMGNGGQSVAEDTNNASDDANDTI